MQSVSLSNGLNREPASQNGERRKNARFAMRFPIFVRALGEPWVRSETADVSATGAFFVSDRPFLLNAPIEYVLTFPQDLTKAKRPLLVRFFGMVIRSERVADNTGVYGIAVRNTAHRYLTGEEAAGFTAMQPTITPSKHSKAS
jgi:PilZ domain-containing protein